MATERKKNPGNGKAGKEASAKMKTTEEVVELFRGTLFEDVMNIIKTGDYEAVLREGDVNTIFPTANVLGELNDLEKALYTLRQKTIRKIIASNDEAMIRGESINAMKERLRLMYREYDTMHELLWVVIGQRIPSNGMSLSIKDGWKIVGEKPNEQLNDFMDLLENFGVSATIH